MNKLDAFYRAFREFREETEACPWYKNLREAVLRASSDRDEIECSLSHCIIDELWVTRIEEALPDIDEAIRENRQFIKKEGDVVRIEKAKKTSKASVIHLAQHSGLIDRYDDGNDSPTPKKIYIEENTDNFALYENRFLYMLLCYLRDFVDIRYNAVAANENAYTARLSMAKDILNKKNHITFSAEFSEKSLNDKTVLSESNPIIDRIVSIRKTVESLFSTDLMKTVADAPMLRPPIVKTNVMKMNLHFISACALFEFIMEYKKPGYEIVKKNWKHSPFPAETANEMTLLVALSSFAVRENGNDLRARLEEAYMAEEERRREELERRQEEELERVREAFRLNGENPEGYVLLVEERNRTLENDRLTLKNTQKRLEREMQLSAEKDRTLRALENRATELSERIESAETEKLRAEAESLRQKELCSAQIRRAENEFLEKKQLADEACEERISEEREKFRAEADAVRAELAALSEDHNLVRAQNHALRKMLGRPLPEDCDFTSEEGFRQLERELGAMEKLYREQWSKTKKRIRREILWKKNDDKQ